MTPIFPDSATLNKALIAVLAGSSEPLKAHEIDKGVIKLLNLPEEVTGVIRDGNRTEIQYRLAWCRTKAKKANLIERLPQGSWLIKK